MSTVTATLLTGISAIAAPWMNATGGADTFKTADHPHGVFVLEAYQNHCGYCVENVPNVEALAGFYSYEPRVTVVDLGLDQTKREYQQWIGTHHPNHPVVMDQGTGIWRELGGDGTPTAYLLDCHLEVKWSTVGVWDEGTIKALKTRIDELLADPGCAAE